MKVISISILLIGLFPLHVLQAKEDLSLAQILKAEEIKTYDVPIHKQDAEWLIEEFGPGVKYPINLTKATKNIVWQTRQKIRKKEVDPVRGIIRTFWYTHIKPVFARTGSLDETKEQSDTLHIVLTDLVRNRQIMRYRDMGFTDHNAGMRLIGENWHVMVIGEKHGKFGPLSQIAQEVNATVLTLGGKPSLLSTEYFVDAYKVKGIDIRKSMYLIFVVDYDPSGWVVRDSIMRGFQFYGIKNIQAIDIITPEILTQAELELAIFPLPASEAEENEEWVARVGGIEDEEGNYYGFESDAVPFDRLRQTIIEEATPYIGDPEIIRRANAVKDLAKELNQLIQIQLGLNL